MLFSVRPLSGMGAPRLPAMQPARHFPQWSRTALLTLSNFDDEVIEKVKKSPPESAGAGAGFIISGDAAARVTHLEHSVRFLQEQHRLMLSGLHAEIEALRERNRDLQFQLIFNKESSPKPTSPNTEENAETEEAKLKREVSRLEKEAATARSEARAAEARALQLQRQVDTQTEKLRVLELSTKCTACVEGVDGGEEQGAADGGEGSETRAELRARLAEAERLVRRLRGDAERRRREVPDLNRDGRGPTSVTNLLFDGAANTHAHLQCMKNSLHASLRATGLDSYGFHNKYHFPPAPPPVHTPDFWREPMREDYNIGGRGRSSRRPLTLPELSGQTMHRSTVYANNHTRPRANGYDKNKKSQPSNGEVANGKTPEEQPESRLYSNLSKLLPNRKDNFDSNSKTSYPELKMVVTKMIPHGNVSNGQTSQTTDAGARARPRRHRKHVDHT